MICLCSPIGIDLVRTLFHPQKYSCYAEQMVMDQDKRRSTGIHPPSPLG